MRIFLEQLFRNGQITVPPVGTDWEFNTDAERWVIEFDRAARLAMPGAAPELHFAAAAWAARRLADACRLAIARDAGAEEIASGVKLIEAFGLRAFCRAMLNTNELITVN